LQGTNSGASAPLSVWAFEQPDPRDLSLDWLRAQGATVENGRLGVEPGFLRYEVEDILTGARDCEAVLGASSAKFARDVLARLPRLRFIAKLGIGVDSIDVAAATERGVVVADTPEAASVSTVAENAITMMLALYKRLTYWTPAHMREGGWRGGEFASALEGKTVGIVGFGRIGRAVARRLAGWDAEIIAHDPFATPTPGDNLVDLSELLERADVVTLHCAATPENHHLIGAAALARMKRSAILVNTGRGSLVDGHALASALRENRLAGAALDVFEREPPDPADPLLSLPNVVVTPHAASWTLEAFRDRRQRAARNLVALWRGEPCPDIVNPEALKVQRP